MICRQSASLRPAKTGCKLNQQSAKRLSKVKRGHGNTGEQHLTQQSLAVDDLRDNFSSIHIDYILNNTSSTLVLSVLMTGHLHAQPMEWVRAIQFNKV